jgi:hypothetical protein
MRRINSAQRSSTGKVLSAGDPYVAVALQQIEILGAANKVIGSAAGSRPGWCACIEKPPERPDGCLGDAPADSGPVPPMMVGSDQLVGHLLLLWR